ncbi:MAG: DNA-processing protein DprA [Clostridium sp.]|jgi:DNA processing protein|nr:DNA-processing protein DprA [Clostridium sp.]
MEDSYGSVAGAVPNGADKIGNSAADIENSGNDRKSHADAVEKRQNHAERSKSRAGDVPEEERKAYAYWLNSVPGIGNRKAALILEKFSSPRAAYAGTEKEYASILGAKDTANLLSFTEKWEVEARYANLREQGIRFVDWDSHEYPRRLREIPAAPYGLFYLGALPEEALLSVAVVGARECSEYGRYVAMEFGKALGEYGVCVISGMARGIDGIAQEAALKAGGVSYGVLGCGVDVCYPARNKAIYRELIQRGGVLSAYPPGTLPKPNHFPPRNRIVSGLADALVVIEARRKSGTLITVDMALEQGREVYAAPGRLTDRLSDGCNRLLRQGAGVFLSPQDFLDEMKTLFPRKAVRVNAAARQGVFYEKGAAGAGFSPQGDRKAPPRGNGGEEARNPENGEGKPWKPENDLEKSVLDCLDFYPQSVEQIRARLPASRTHQETMLILMRLCMAGQALQAGKGYFLKSAFPSASHSFPLSPHS